MITVELPAELVLGDFDDAVETLRAAAAANDPETTPPLLDASGVRRIDGAGLQWLLACLGAAEQDAGAALAQLRSNDVVDEALRIAGAEAQVAEHRVA